MDLIIEFSNISSAVNSGKIEVIADKTQIKFFLMPIYRKGTEW